jgi:hypothetical protein
VYGTLCSALASFRSLRICGLLLEQDGAETSVEGTNTLVFQHLAEATDKTVGIGRLRDETDSSSLKRAEGDVCEEFGKGGRSQVDSCAVIGGGLISKEVDGLLLEQLISSKLESTLQEVSRSSRAKSSQKCSSAFICDDLSDAAEKTSVVRDGIELDSCLDAVTKLSVH